MNSPLILLIFPALLLAYPLYAVLRDKKRAKTSLEKIIEAGFEPSSVFEMMDLIVAIDRKNGKIALVDFSHTIHPRGMEPPVDRGSFSTRLTVVVPADEIDCLSVHFQSSGYIESTLIYKAPNRINSTLKLNIPFESKDKSRVMQLVSLWPTRTVVTNPDA